MPTIVMQLSLDQDRALRRGAAAAAGLAPMLSALQAQATPLFEGAPATELDCTWYLDVPPAHADEALARLRATPGVAGAYVKPDDAPAALP